MLKVAAALGAAVAVVRAQAPPAPRDGVVAVKAGPTAVGKVVNLLGDMKKQVQSDADTDQAAYEKYDCWCKTNRGHKNEAVRTAKARIDELGVFLEESAAKAGQLKSEIAELGDSIAADQKTLSEATALRGGENAEFQVTEADTKESFGLINEAIEVLSKVQLLQKSKGVKASAAQVRPMLLEVQASTRGVVSKTSSFRDVLQRDLWDALSSIDGVNDEAPQQFLSPRRRLSALEQRQLAPETTARPSDAKSYNTKTKSYNSASGGVLGMFSEMSDDFSRNLATIQKEELEATISFHSLKAAKLGEIKAATERKTAKSAALAGNQNKAAQSKDDLQATEGALSADEKFLMQLEENCEANQVDYDKRHAIRSQEEIAIGEAIKILTEDDARDLFGQTVSFLQVPSFATNSQKQEAADRILRTAKKHNNLVLASLATSVRLDAFTKVIEAMEKMTKELTKERLDEAAKRDVCNKEIDHTEDEITTGTNKNDDLVSQKRGLSNDIEKLKVDISTLNGEVGDMQVSLKQAGESRKAENAAFQQGVSDQRATVNVLKKAEERLQAFYAEKGSSLAQVGQEPAAIEPGVAAPPPPPKPAAYEKSGGAGGVMQVLAKIISDATSEEAEQVVDEQHAQAAYEALARDINEGITAHRAAVVEKTELVEQTLADKSETEASLLSNGVELAKLADALKAVHLDCDWLLKHFDLRQQALQEELDSISQAKAVLSGADFGNADQQ